MKHILIIDSNDKQSKALLALARVLKSVKILSEKEWELVEDSFTAKQIQKGLKSANATESDFRKALTKMRGK